MDRLASFPAFARIPMKIAVLGAGITGLSAAYHLRKRIDAGVLPPDTRIDLFDERSRVGGVLATVERGGFQIEQSADNFITTVPWGIDLCKELGLGDQLVQTNANYRRTYVVRKGKLRLLPDGFLMMAPTKLWPMAVTPILSPLGKLRAGLEPFIPARRDDGDESLARFVRRRLGKEVYERLVEPLVSGVYAADMEKLSVLATLPRFREMERDFGSLVWAMQRQLRENRRLHLQEQSGARYSMFVTLRDGLSAMCERIATRLPEGTFLPGRKIVSIEKCVVPDTFAVRWKLGDSSGEIREYDAILCALPSHKAARVLERSLPKLAGLLGQIEHQGTAIATFAFRSDQMKLRVAGMGFVVPTIEKSPILAASFSSLKYEHRAPAGHLLIRVFAGGARAPEMAGMPEAELVPILKREMNKILRIEGEPLFSVVSHWPHTMPQYHVGHRELVRDIKAEADTEPTFAIAGNAFHGVGIPNCVQSGRLAAERIAEALAGPPAS